MPETKKSILRAQLVVEATDNGGRSSAASLRRFIRDLSTRHGIAVRQLKFLDPQSEIVEVGDLESQPKERK